jgi:signal transduction histidine kinase
MALGLLSVATGDMFWNIYDLILHIEPYPSVADIFYVAAPFFFVLAFIFFPRAALSPNQNLQLSLDVAVCVMAAAVILWPWQLVPIIESYGSFSLELVLSLTYPCLDLVLLALLFAIALRPSEQTLGNDKLWLSAGITGVIAADFGFAALSATDGYQAGHFIDALWVWGYSLFVIAAYVALLPRHHHHWRWLEQFRLSGIAAFLPYLAIFLTYGFSIFFRGYEGLTEFGVSAGAGLVTLLVLVRQVVAFRENQALTKELKALSEDLERRVEERTRELEDSRNRLSASEKLASLGRLTAGLAHEINTPLAAARNALLQAKTLADEYRASIAIPTVTAEDHQAIASELGATLKDSDNALERLGEFVRRMRSHTRSSGTSLDFDPRKVAADASAMLEHRARKMGIQLVLEPLTESIQIHGDPSRFTQVVSNLLVNAMDACEERKDVPGQVTVQFARQLGKVVMTVKDNGSGISTEVLPKIFEPMFTTKDVGKGTGLGLSIVHNIITGHMNGEIRVDSMVGKGTSFYLSFPDSSVRQGSPVLATA